ncbi:hypothetical protein [Acetatifactor muris]|uniref:hypothetical protein n=1 Tax=Acetatifactor muris TaxID=879566 RepID=UPI0023EFC626|nr:hypothetical protein [Acetatifactor muris]
MKLRYQMRGLGIGMIVTALLMGVTAEKVPLSDAEIRTRAAELGMVESDSLKLTDIQNTPVPGENHSGDEAGPGPGPEEGTKAEEDPDSEAEPTQQLSETQGEEDADAGSGETSGEEGTTSDPDEAAGESSAETVTVEVEPGVTSYRICIMLEEEGLVEDAAAFDTYLCDNGYSRKIKFGTYQIPAGASEEEIAKIITRSR